MSVDQTLAGLCRHLFPARKVAVGIAAQATLAAISGRAVCDAVSASKSGIRFGTPAGTSRGFDAVDFRKVGELILTVLRDLRGDRIDDGTTREIQCLVEAHLVPRGLARRRFWSSKSGVARSGSPLAKQPVKQWAFGCGIGRVWLAIDPLFGRMIGGEQD